MRRIRFMEVALSITLLLVFLTACGGGGGSNTGGVGGDETTKPDAPSGVSAQAGDSQVIVSWDTVSDATSYNIYMASESGVTKENYASLPDGMKHERVTSPFTHTDLTNGKTYYFVATAVNNEGESTESDEVSATPSSTIPHINIIAVAGGDSHSIALKSDGTVWAWGWGNAGELGNGTAISTSSKIPVQASGLTGVTAIAGGDSHSFAFGDSHTIALKSDGTVWAWGLNDFGQLGNGTTTNSSTPIQISGLSSAIGIAGGGAHSIALKSDGTVWTWGSNFTGQLGNGTYTDSSLPVQASGLTEVIAIAGGWSHSLALRSDGTIWAWGNNVDDQLGIGFFYTDRKIPVQVSGLTEVIAIAGGESHSLALKSDGTVWAWGSNSSGELGNGTFTSSGIPVQVSGLTGVIAIAGGGPHSLALKSDGTVWAWGDNEAGELGNGTTTNSSTPVQVSGLTGVIAIAGGGRHSLAVKSDGTVMAWGANDTGQLGNGTLHSSSIPGQVSGL